MPIRLLTQMKEDEFMKAGSWTIGKREKEEKLEWSLELENDVDPI